MIIWVLLHEYKKCSSQKPLKKIAVGIGVIILIILFGSLGIISTYAYGSNILYGISLVCLLFTMYFGTKYTDRQYIVEYAHKDYDVQKNYLLKTLEKRNINDEEKIKYLISSIDAELKKTKGIKFSQYLKILPLGVIASVISWVITQPQHEQTKYLLIMISLLIILGGISITYNFFIQENNYKLENLQSILKDICFLKLQQDSEIELKVN